MWLEIKSDASAALAIIQRQGLGKVRHIDCSYLYIQKVCAERTLAFKKVPGTKNPADACTKGLAKEKMTEYVHDIGAEYQEGRASEAPNLQPSCADIPVLERSEGGCMHVNAIFV